MGQARGNAMCNVGEEPRFCVAVSPAAIPLAASLQSSFLLPRPQGSTAIACTALSCSVLVVHEEMRVLAVPAVYFLGGLRAKLLLEQLDSSALACAQCSPLLNAMENHHDPERALPFGHSVVHVPCCSDAGSCLQRVPGSVSPCNECIT